MSVILETTDGPLEVSDACVEAVVSRAEYVATLTGECLSATGLLPKTDETPTEPVRLPGGFLLELGAVLQMAVWERAGIRTHIDAGLPSFEEAAADLAHRASENVASFDRFHSATLLSRIFPLWIERLAWSGPELFKAEMQLDAVEEDAFVNGLAEFLWRHRDSLGPVLQKGDSQHDPEP
jgi:hypothetical protein